MYFKNRIWKLLFLLVLLGSACIHAQAAETEWKVCHPVSASRPLVAAFLYTTTKIITQQQLKDYAQSIAHLDVLIYSLGVIRDDNTLTLKKITQQNLITLRQWIKQNHLKTKLLLSIGGWGHDHVAKIFKDPQEQIKFINSVIAVLKSKDFHLDGIDVDWENEFATQPIGAQQLPDLMKALRNGFDKNNLKSACITIDLPASVRFAKRTPNPASWADSVDWAHLMAYDYYNNEPPEYSELDGALGEVIEAYPSKSPPYSNINIVSSADYYVKQGLPKRKLIVALPFYGKLYFIQQADQKHSNGLHQPLVDQRSPIDLDYQDIYKQYGTYDSPKKNTQFHQYTFKQSEGTENSRAFWLTQFLIQSKQLGSFYAFVSYPDPRAVSDIANYVAKKGYLGLSAWHLMQDLPYENPDSLVRQMVNKK